MPEPKHPCGHTDHEHNVIRLAQMLAFMITATSRAWFVTGTFQKGIQ